MNKAARQTGIQSGSERKILAVNRCVAERNIDISISISEGRER